jgi:phosphoglycolate phosphatase
VEGFIFDCDGVLWKGDTLIEGVPETIEMLRRMGKKIIFVTNNSTKSRKAYQSKFSSMGLKAQLEEIYSSSFAAAAYLDANKLPKDKKVYVVGEAGIPDELELLGYTALGGPQHAGMVSTQVYACLRVRGVHLMTCGQPTVHLTQS